MIISKNGVPVVDIVSHLDVATKLADILRKITGASFVVKPSGAGIVVDLGVNHLSIVSGQKWQSPGHDEKDDYVIRESDGNLYLLGTTAVAASHAVFDLLYRIGYRQYFPGETWEHIPVNSDISVDLDVSVSPSYIYRRIFYGWEAFTYNLQEFGDWNQKNRIYSGFNLSVGHAYRRIISKNQAEFDAHPEYYCLVDGVRVIDPNSKMCLSNLDLRALIVSWAQQHFVSNPDDDSISMEPSDGSGWCNCQDCATLGSITDRATGIANEVADAIPQGKYVGMLAYNLHSQPPENTVRDNVIVLIAQQFIRGGGDFFSLVDGWRSKCSNLGAYSYYSVYPWDFGLPGKGKISDPIGVSNEIKKMNTLGLRYAVNESSDGWANFGIGYYISSRQLFDSDEDIGAEIDGFYESFGEAEDSIREFMAHTDISKPHLDLDDQMSRMFVALDDAKSVADSSIVSARIDSLILYCWCVHLYNIYKKEPVQTERQQKFEDLIRYAYRARKSLMFHSVAMYAYLDRTDPLVSIPSGAGYNDPEETNPWKDSIDYSPSDINGFLSAGLMEYHRKEPTFTPIEYSYDLLPIETGIDLSGTTIGPKLGGHTFYCYADSDSKQIDLTVTGGLVAHYRDRGNVRIKLYRIISNGTKYLVDEDNTVHPDGVAVEVSLSAPKKGLYVIDIHDGGDMTLVDWPKGYYVNQRVDVSAELKWIYTYTMYFYVPAGVLVVGGYSEATRGKVYNQDGTMVYDFAVEGKGYFNIPSSGTTPEVWRVLSANHEINLMTVPPYMAKYSKDLLVPREAA